MRSVDTRSDRLELVGDLLPTAQEQAELNAYHDACERNFLASQHADVIPSYVGLHSKLPRVVGLCSACVPSAIPDHGFGFGL